MQQCLARLYYSQDEVIVQEIPGLTPEHPFNRGFLYPLKQIHGYFSYYRSWNQPFLSLSLNARSLPSMSGLTRTI
jgi:hypothetical protein